MKYIFTCLLIVTASYMAKGQSVSYTDKDYAHKPVWIDMIKDTTANFFVVEHAFKVYFQHHEKPEGEDDKIGEHEAREKNPSKRERRKMQSEQHLRIEVKKYERWRDRMLPYVQADGAILTPSQRLQIWKDNQVK